MKKVGLIAGFATLVAILEVATIGPAGYAQDDDSGGPFDFGGRFREAIAGILGMSVEEYGVTAEQAQNQVLDEAVAEGWLTQEQAELLQRRMAQTPSSGMPDMDRGFGEFPHGMMGGEDNLLSIAADKLGLSVTELLTELQDGKSITEVADEKGVDTQIIVDAYLVQVKRTWTKP